MVELLTALVRDASSGSGQKGGAQQAPPGRAAETSAASTTAISSRLSVAILCNSRDSLDTVTRAVADSEAFRLFVLHGDMQHVERYGQFACLRALAAEGGKGGRGREEEEGSVTKGAGRPPRQPANVGRGEQQQQQPGSIADEGRQASIPSSAEDLASQMLLDLPRSSPMLDPSIPLALITTDVCLHSAPREVLPLGLTLLFNYDLPRQKELYSKRVVGVFGGGKERRSTGADRFVVIDFFTAAEVALFRENESWYSMSSASAAGATIEPMPVQVSDIFMSSR